MNINQELAERIHKRTGLRSEREIAVCRVSVEEAYAVLRERIKAIPVAYDLAGKRFVDRDEILRMLGDEEHSGFWRGDEADRARRS